MRVVIVEDDRKDAQQLVERVDDYARDRHLPVMVDTYASVDDLGMQRSDEGALELTAAGRRARFAGYDLAFIDMYLDDGEPAGMDVARALRAAGLRCPIVVTTVSVDFAVEGYEVASGYLVKPYEAHSLYAVLDRLFPRPDVITVPLSRSAKSHEAIETQSVPGDGWQMDQDTGAMQFEADSVRMLRASGHYLDVVMTGGRIVRLRAGIASASKALEGDERFCHCVRGSIVNLDMVSRIEGSSFVMDDGTIVPISRRELTKARDAFHARGIARLTAGMWRA
ncbi:LytR/AlgR family response regulator transcription factor [Bifidobacterium oedipodis]|uniref:DNA-binding response regulator n=1 Tax=Bifidobacterium oedipodis TaxID=2675322 RepID=A0A7Y0EPI4_9BIFI|nr:LytTR family transcriptional regulator DNA-binding domain-containing protein [Bifidobacterium sp. DSM 109957]NMM94056.1 DNA-binding response regulator [Bifidobacterium sp. DSM 109957]